jgi:YidC/Oxa1 family membrane protein insertase
MGYLTLLLEAKVWTESAWGAIINLFSFIGNYGWMIIVFTICLKLVLSPFDFMQKHTTSKNQRMMAIMQPELDKLQKKYSDNKEMLQQKQMEVYKKYNYNVVGSCLFMFVGMAIPMFIFFSLFSSLNQISAIFGVECLFEDFLIKIN